MSRAFVKEDAEITERSTRRRSASGLPPGALNYLTADGARQLQARLTQLQAAAERDGAEISHLAHTLASATIVEPRTRPESVVFGSTVTLRSSTGKLTTHRIVGVDEVHLADGQVSWVSPIGKALLGAESGQRVRLAGNEEAAWTVVEID